MMTGSRSVFSLPLDPEGCIKTLWDVFVMCLLIYCAFEVPFSAAFYGTGSENDPMNRTMTIWTLWGAMEVEGLDLIVCIVFLLDILFCFITSYIQNGRIESDYARIAQHYMQGWLVLDLIALLPADKIAPLFIPPGTVPTGAFRLLRIIRLIKLFARSDLGPHLSSFLLRALRRDAPPDRLLALARIVRPLFVMFFTAHLLGCIFVLLAGLNSPNWLEHYLGPDGENAPSGTLYGIALYWAVVTVTTMGYGDIVPVTDTERSFVVVAALIGVVAFSSFVNRSACMAIIAAFRFIIRSSLLCVYHSFIIRLSCLKAASSFNRRGSRALPKTPSNMLMPSYASLVLQ